MTTLFEQTNSVNEKRQNDPTLTAEYADNLVAPGLRVKKARQGHRIAWLTATLLLKKTVSLTAYRAEFDATPRTYYRDIDLLDEIGVTVQSHRGDGRVDLKWASLS